MTAVTKQAIEQTLNTNSLFAQACEQSGLTDYGNLAFVESLKKMLACFSNDAKFHELGLTKFRQEVLRGLTNRLRFEEDLKRHPEILAEDVSDPIIILGLPRSGTTKMQRMMGTDETLLSTQLWQLMNPARYPNLPDKTKDPRVTSLFVEALLGDAKENLQAAHHFSAEQIDEDWGLFDFTFNDLFQNNFTPSVSWRNWVLSRSSPSDADNYGYVKSLFQYLQWQQGGKNQRRWLMKNCGHVGHLRELVETFPNATLVHAHRHPMSCVPSFAKIVSDLWGMKVCDVDPVAAGQFTLKWEKLFIDRYLQARDELNLNDKIIDVQYEDIRDNPMPVFKAIYERAGHVMSNSAEQKMMQWDAQNEQHQHGKHSYSLQEFGLSEALIQESFASYIQRFIQ